MLIYDIKILPHVTEKLTILLLGRNLHQDFVRLFIDISVSQVVYVRPSFKPFAFLFLSSLFFCVLLPSCQQLKRVAEFGVSPMIGPLSSSWVSFF